MAILKTDEKEIELADNSSISEAAEELGVPIPCGEGICGACEIEVVEGLENLNKLTDEETALGMEGNRRLACVCTIKTGTVKIKF